MLGTIFIAFFCLIVFRLFYMFFFKKEKKHSKKNARTLIVIGSGGHTLEMLKQIKTLNSNLYQPRLYVMADKDISSEYKIKEVEETFNKITSTNYSIVKIPRSRVVNQSYITSVFTTFYSFLKSIPIVLNFNPDLILCNGPGTCIPICTIGFLFNAIFFFNIKIVFFESICRVKTLSLTGKILLYIADVIIVQWLDLHKSYPQTVFLGRL